VNEFVVEDLDLAAEPAALAAAGRSLDSSGLLLLGEMHGVRENPLVIRAVMQAFGLTSLALEWPDELAPVIWTFLAGGPLADHPWLWGGDGRITAGPPAMLAERSTAGPLGVILFDGVIGAGGRSRSGTGAVVSGTSSHADSRTVPALKGRYGSTRTAANSFWTSP
jgi:hypothetical protein